MTINKMNKECKSYYKIYWRTWFILIASFFLGAILKIYPFDFDTAMMFSFVVLMILGGVLLNASHVRLMSYLEKNHKEKWKELRATSFWGIGYDRSHVREFLKSKETFGDLNVEKLRKDYNKTELLCIVHFGLFWAAPIIGGALILIIFGILHSNGFI